MFVSSKNRTNYFFVSAQYKIITYVDCFTPYTRGYTAKHIE